MKLLKDESKRIVYFCSDDDDGATEIYHIGRGSTSFWLLNLVSGGS